VATWRAEANRRLMTTCRSAGACVAPAPHARMDQLLVPA